MCQYHGVREVFVLQTLPYHRNDRIRERTVRITERVVRIREREEMSVLERYPY